MDYDVNSFLRARQPRRRILSRLLLCASLAILFFVPFRARAQSCALCYTQAASSGPRMIRALRSGILILVLPPTLMSIAVIFVAYAKRNQFRGTDCSDPEETPDADASLDSPNTRRHTFGSYQAAG
jgi:hypothetical protein